MNLTAGTALQNHKYVIQKQLHQSDVGVTYQAQHAYLDQPVLLQTLSEALRQRSNFAQLRQQFLSQVRAIAQQPQGNLRVLDCFEESDLPFAVFEIPPNLAGNLPQLADWIPAIEPELATAEKRADLPRLDQVMGLAADLPNRPNAVNINKADQELGQPFSAAQLDAPSQLTAEPELRSPAHFQTSELQATQLQATELQATESPNPGPNGATPAALTAPRSVIGPELQANRPPSQTAPVTLTRGRPTATQPALTAGRPWNWMPLALLATSLVAGLLGAGFGYLLRFSSASETGTPRLTPRLFSREQSFPSGADWPVSETPQTFSDPTPVEAPVYRSTSPVLPDYQPLPAASLEPPSLAPLPVEPVAPAALPSPALEVPLPTEPVEPVLPQIGNAPVPAPAVEPAPPAPEPPPPAPEPPAPEPAELPREPQVLKN